MESYWIVTSWVAAPLRGGPRPDEKSEVLPGSVRARCKFGLSSFLSATEGVLLTESRGHRQIGHPLKGEWGCVDEEHSVYHTPGGSASCTLWGHTYSHPVVLTPLGNGGAGLLAPTSRHLPEPCQCEQGPPRVGTDGLTGRSCKRR